MAAWSSSFEPEGYSGMLIETLSELKRFLGKAVSESDSTSKFAQAID